MSICVISYSQFACSSENCAVIKMVITKPIGNLFENGQKLDEVDMEKKTFYYTSMNDRGRKNAPLKVLKSSKKRQ